MKISRAVLAMAMVAAACATSRSSLDQLPVGEYVGHYTGGLPGESWFRRCGAPPSDSAWWVTWTDRAVSQADSARRAGMLVTSRASFVRLRAAMTTGGEIGPGGPGRPALLVRELLEARPAREGDCVGNTPGTSAHLRSRRHRVEAAAVGHSMTTIPIHAAEASDDDTLAEVAHTFGDCRTLAELLRWAGRQSPRVQVAEIVTQDEYTHDVVLPFGSLFLSFDTT